MRNTMAVLAALTALAVPMTASAQFGGLMKAVPGVGGGAPAGASGNADAFLANAMLSTKNVMIASTLLSAALQNRTDMAALKQKISGISNAQSFKEVGANKAELASDLNAMTEQKDLVGALSQTYQNANAEQKKLIGDALINLGVGIARNVVLAQQAPGMVSGLSANPMMLRRAGELKMAAELIGMQSKSFVTIAPALPKLMTALKIKAPAASATSEFQPMKP